MAPAAIIMGKSGVGKTTFYNKLCETDHEATYSSKSLTRQLFRSEVTHGGQSFTVIDTPGTDSKDEVFKHSFLLKEAMTNEPVNAIFVLVQYNDRCDSALEEFDKTIAYLKPDYNDMVVVMISKFDAAPSQHSARIQNEYVQQFKDEGFPRIMFHSKDMDAVTVTSEMIRIMSNMPKKKMVYDEKDFLKYFRVADESRAQKKVVKKCEEEIADTLSGYKDMLQSLGSIEDKDDIILSAIASSRYDVDAIYEKFITQFGEQMIDLDCYTNSIALQKVVESSHREFRDNVKNLMSYNPDDTNDWRNFVRKCQYCGIVWVKVSGCNGVTTCGNRDDSRDVSNKPWFQYSFSFEGGMLRWKKNSRAKTDKAVQHKATQGKGCGRDINWSEQPRLSKEELAKLLEVKGLDNMIESMMKKPKFNEVMGGYSKTIDVSFSK